MNLDRLPASAGRRHVAQRAPWAPEGAPSERTSAAAREAVIALVCGPVSRGQRLKRAVLALPGGAEALRAAGWREVRR